MDIQAKIDAMTKEFKDKYKKEWFDLVDGESLGIVGKIIDALQEKWYELDGKAMDINNIYQVIIRSKIYWSEVLKRQKEVYMYKSLVEGMRGVLRSSQEGDIKSVKLLADLLLKGKLDKIGDDEKIDEIFDVGDEELKEILRSRNNE